MATVGSLYSSRTASSSLLRAFRYQSQASTLRNLSFFSGVNSNDAAGFSQTARDASMFSSIIQNGNRSLFGAVYKDAAAFNQSMSDSVSAAAGLNPGSGNSLLGQLVNQMG